MRIMLVGGARPNFMKLAPLSWQFGKQPGVELAVVHTGQHYDRSLSGAFFEELGIPTPDVNLGVGSGSHAFQTAQVMERFEPVLLERSPDVVVVVGDVNSTLACALTATKRNVPVAHVEAGLRSFDRTMPEEINRLLTDAISQWLFVSEPSGVANLLREGMPHERIHFVGNVMIDTLLAMRHRARDSMILNSLGVVPRSYAVTTLHRPSNVDNLPVLQAIVGALAKIARLAPVVFPVHPRTRAALDKLPRTEVESLHLIEPLGYLDFLQLVANARVVVTDSGGIQEETTILGVPCLTLRANTERPITVDQGTNRLVGMDPRRIEQCAIEALSAAPAVRPAPPLWDGQAARRIVEILAGPQALNGTNGAVGPEADRRNEVHSIVRVDEDPRSSDVVAASSTVRNRSHGM